MKKRQMERWVKALRSGKYKQGKIRLCDSTKGTYCCLGVLSEINIKHLKYGAAIGRDGLKEYGYESHGLPQGIMAWCDIKYKYGVFGNQEDANMSLAKLNDSGKSFAEIADIIEQNYKRL